MKTRYYIGFLCLLFSQFLLAQQYTHYSVQNGLPSDNVYRITQDANGFIWFITDKGMVKYNGSSFKIFTTRQGLPTNDIWSVQPTPDGKVWFMSKSPRIGYIYQDSVYSFGNRKNEILNPVQHNVIGNTIEIINYDATYFLNSNNEWEEKKTLISPNFELAIIFNHPKIRQINTNLKRDSIYLLDRIGNISKSYPFPAIMKNIATRGQLNDSLYCWTNRYGYTLLNLNSFKFYSRNFKDEIQLKTVDYSRFHVVNNEIQFTGKDFVAVLDKNYHLINKVSIPKELSSHFSFIDKNNNIWIATMANGVYKIAQSKRKGVFCLEHEKVGLINTLGDTIVTSVFDKGFYKYNLNNRVFEPFIQEKGYMYKACLVPEINTQFYITNTKIIAIKDAKKTLYNYTNSPYKSNETARQLVYYQGALYGNYSFGINKINPTNLSIIQEYKQAGVGTMLIFQKKLRFDTSDGIKTQQNENLQSLSIG